MRRLTTVLTALVAAIAMLAGPAAAAPATDCLRAGQNVLRSAGLFDAAARGQVNYAIFDNTGGTGDIRTDLGDQAFLPISTVFALHRNSPELFSWCD